VLFLIEKNPSIAADIESNTIIRVEAEVATRLITHPTNASHFEPTNSLVCSERVEIRCDEVCDSLGPTEVSLVLMGS